MKKAYMRLRDDISKKFYNVLFSESRETMMVIKPFLWNFHSENQCIDYF